MPSETYGRNGATPIFRSFLQDCPVPTQADGVVGTLNCALSYTTLMYSIAYVVISTFVPIKSSRSKLDQYCTLYLNK